MLTHIRRLAFGLAAIAAACAVAGTAMADGTSGGGSAGNSCDPATNICVVTATTPGSPGSSGSGSSGSSPGRGGSSGGGSSTPTAPSMASPPPCTYAAEPTYQPPAGSDPHPTGSGSWYQETCYQYMTASMTAWVPEVSMVWLTAPPPANAVVPTPAQLAAEAQSELRLTAPVIASSPRPGSPQMVGLNMWAWVGSSWSAQSATAAVGGVSVTATATPVSTTWNFGDGTSLACGQGTVYNPSFGPTASSPTCGHTYHTPGSYTVAVTVSWHVGWAGAGQAGTFDAMTTTSTEQVLVEASNAIVTR
jgi:hypothetical protein